MTYSHFMPEPEELGAGAPGVEAEASDRPGFDVAPGTITVWPHRLQGPLMPAN